MVKNMKKKKKLPEYEIVESIKYIKNPEKETLREAKAILLKYLQGGDKDGND